MVLDAIKSLFKDEEEGGNLNYHINIEELDPTAFFTGAVMGLSIFYEQLTGDKKDFLDFTHLCNTLAVQYLLKEEL